MKGIGWFIASVALVAVLIPFPELLWFSLGGLALIWLVTPLKAAPKQDGEASKAAKGTGAS